jgi:dipeptidyl aminopeptidase/acylaminoacyl peptidase
MHGDTDATVPISQSETFALALQSAGIDATMMKIEDAGHGGARFSGAEPFERIEQFFGKHLRPKSP